MHFKIIKLILFYLVLPLTLFAQEDTFPVEETFRIEPWDRWLNRLTIADMNGNGIDEIITTHVDYYSTNHQMAIYENMDTIFVGPRCAGNCRSSIVMDYNQDGIDDIVAESEIRDEDFEEPFGIYFGPDFEYEMWGIGYFDDHNLWRGGNRVLGNGNTIPFFLHKYKINNYFWENDTRFLEYWDAVRIMEGTRENEGEPQYIADICQTAAFIYRQIDEETYYFALGENRYYNHTHDISRRLYYQIFTNYNRDFDDPDSLTLQVTNNRTDSDSSGLADYMAVEDFNRDGDLEWITPWWRRTSGDTFTVYLPIFDPDGIELIDQYEEEIWDMTYHYAAQPVVGIAPVDVNEDGRLEIMLLLQNKPIRIIDRQSLEIIMESDWVVPDQVILEFGYGHFDDSGRVQFLIRDLNTTEFIIYSLPEHWQIPPVGVDGENRIPPLPKTVMLNPAFPNPFNSSTRVSYTLPYPMNIELGIYDLRGRKLQVLTSGTQAAGAHTLHWNASGLPAGSYLLRMADEGGSMKDVKKVVLVK